MNKWAADGTPRAEGSEEALVWPGKLYGLDTPVPSIRLKRLRRGLQDIEYLWLLEQNRRPGIAQLIAADLFAFGGTDAYGEHCLDGRPNGWIADPAAWSLARRLIARELLAAFEEGKGPRGAGLPAGDDVSKFEQQVEWARLTESVRGVRVEVEGVRVSIDPKDAKTPVRLEAIVSLFNATRNPFSGRLGLAGTPADWNVEGTGAAIEKLESRRPSRRVVTAKAPSIPSNSDGVFGMQVTVEPEGGAAKGVPARVCAITSQRLSQGITLDGKLDDWPLGTTNVAGDFMLTGALDVPKRGRASADRASQPTLVFVCHDANYLYVGFNCADDRMEERIISRGNTVRYDDLWPAGEDLVEVVLDPTHRAVDAGDLLHFVVKANGAVISERGVPCLAGVARHSDWPAGVEAALDDASQQDRWTVELRIPLRALVAKQGVWGVNFGRYQARLGEYSSWSGARRYLYSPASLGNLRVE